MQSLEEGANLEQRYTQVNDCQKKVRGLAGGAFSIRLSTTGELSLRHTRDRIEQGSGIENHLYMLTL